jgi:hypothetical protein
MIMTISILITMAVDVQVRKESEKNGCLILNIRMMTEEIAVVDNLKPEQIARAFVGLVGFYFFPKIVI